MAGSSTSDNEFTDLEIRVFQRQEQGYPVEITLGGQQEFPRGYLLGEVLPWSSSGDTTGDGRRLFELLFKDGTLRGAWAEARGRAAQRRIRLRIDPQAAELHTLPWELMQEDAVMVAAQGDTPFSRYLPIALPWSGGTEERPLKVLVAISDPNDIQAKPYELPRADIPLERKALEDAFAGVDKKDLQVDFLEAPITLERLEEALRKGYHILHYLGHGAFNDKRQQAALYLQDADGNAKRALDDEIVGMLARQGVRPLLVFLAACQSAVRSSADAFLGLGPKLVSAGVPAVVAMQDFVTVETARKFSGVFYKRLIEHGQIDRAGNEARSNLLTAGRPDAAVPVVFLRLKSAQLWDKEVNARGEILGGTLTPPAFWNSLIMRIRKGKCTPIIGPHAYGRWLPSRDEVAEMWARQNAYPYGDKVNLARVSQFLATTIDPDFPRTALLDTLARELQRRLPEDLRPQKKDPTFSELLQAVDYNALTADDPNEVHRVLAALNLPLYLTTNFAGFMALALAKPDRHPKRELCRWNETLDEVSSIFEDRPDYKPSAEEPLVYHFFGTDEVAESLVLTEDNYFDWLIKISSERERVPDVIRKAMTTTSLMFLGYSMHDIEFRVIMRGLVSAPRLSDIKHVAVQLDVADAKDKNIEAVQAYLQKYFQNAQINIYWGSMEQFIAELKDQWETANK